MADMTIKLASRIEESEAKSLDPSRLGVGMTGTPRAAEVEGQARTLSWLSCPWCSVANRCTVDEDDDDQWFRCGGCGGAFRAE